MFVQVLSVQISDVYWKLIKAGQYSHGENSSFGLHSFVTATDNYRKIGARHIRTFHLCVIKWPSVNCPEM